MATWLDDTITALKNLGGEAHLNDIFKEVKRIRKTLSPSWTRTIQKELERHSSDSIVWKSKYRGKEDLFYSAKGIGQGVWGLRQKRNFWFVSQSQTFKFERPGGYLWAPYTLIRLAENNFTMTQWEWFEKEILSFQIIKEQYQQSPKL